MRFGPPILGNSLGELAQLRRMTTIEAYQKNFLALLCRTEPLSELQQVQLFIAGLGKPLQTNIELQHLTHLHTTISLARAYEQCLEESPVDPKPPLKTPQLRASPKSSTPMSGNVAAATPVTLATIGTAMTPV